MAPFAAALSFTLALLITHVVIAAPCDIFDAGGTPCAAAHSMVRALYAAYAGRLYQLKRSGDNATLDIIALGAGGFADAVSHERFCAANPVPPPSPTPSPSNGLPAFGTRVKLEPVAMLGYAFRHCYSQGFVTPTADSGDDHAFVLRAALSGAPGAVSFESVNYPGQYIAPMPGDLLRPGIVPAPGAAAASWTITNASGGGYTLVSAVAGTVALSVGANLSGTCAHSYSPPSASVYLLPPQPGAAWAITPDSGPTPYPPRADCVVQQIYDQSGNGNHMLPATPAINNPAYDNPVNATRHSISVGGHRVYGAFFETGMGYRAQNTTGVALGNDAETLYMVTSGTHYNGECCFDYGNSENDCDNPGAFCDGCMEAIYFGSGGGWCGGGGTGGPWVLADLENGLWGCDTPGGGVPANATGLPHAFVTAMVKGGTNGFAIKGANAGSDASNATDGVLRTMWDGPRPPGYQPMHKTGAIILGVGGDNVARQRRQSGTGSGVGVPGLSMGTFYEGVLTAGYSTDAADDAVQADILAARYGA